MRFFGVFVQCHIYEPVSSDMFHIKSRDVSLLKNATQECSSAGTNSTHDARCALHLLSFHVTLSICIAFSFIAVLTSKFPLETVT